MWSAPCGVLDNRALVAVTVAVAKRVTRPLPIRMRPWALTRSVEICGIFECKMEVNQTSKDPWVHEQKETAHRRPIQGKF